MDRAVAVLELKDLACHLGWAETVVCAMSSAVPVVGSDLAPQLRNGSLPLLIDLGIPRNVAPDLETAVPGLEVVDLDDLKAYHGRERADLRAAMRLAVDTIEHHRDLYDRIIQSLQGRNAGE
jgi:glutamyl-tRNA reductase